MGEWVEGTQGAKILEHKKRLWTNRFQWSIGSGEEVCRI